MIFDYQKKGHRTHYISESYVSSPPAAFIIDEYGDMFTLGFESLQSQDCPHGEYAFDILKNGHPTGEYGSRIERRNGKVRIFTQRGWKVYNGRSFL